jgi:hypothetical protein
MPAVFAHQVGSIYVRDEAGLSIPMAQLECAYALRDWFLVGPAYPVTEKDGNLDANGYRWLGQQFGKVMHLVLDLGQGWKPLHPLRATVRGATVLVDFHVPHPPLAFGPCWRRNDTVEFPDGGFSVTDEAGRVAVSAAAVVGEASVLLVLERAPGARAMLWYADQAHGGHGNLHDSDPTEASQTYEFRPGSGQYPSADIAALKGKPYPLWNWCVAFRVPLQPDPPPVAEPARTEPVTPEPVTTEAPPPPEPARPVEAPEPPRLAEVPPPPPPPPPVPLEDMLRPDPEDLPPEAMDSPAWRVLRGEEEAPPPPEPPPEPPRGWLRRLFGG